MIYKRLGALLFSSSLLLLTSCLPTNSVEDVAMIHISAYDRTDDGKLKGTVSIPQFGQKEQAEITELHYTGIGDSIKEVHQNIQSKTPDPLSTGKLSVSLYSENLAKDNLSDIIDYVHRDPRIGRGIFLGILDGDTKEFIETPYVHDSTISEYVNSILRTNTEDNFPTTNLHEFLYAYYAEGMDAYLPILENKEQQVKIKGIGFFKKGKLIMKLPYSKSFIFKLMKEDFKNGTQEVSFKGRNVVMNNIGSSVKYHVKGNINNPSFVIDISIKAFVDEVSSLEIEQKYAITRDMELRFETYYEKQMSKMMKQFQEHRVDPLGLGNELKSRERLFEDKRWRDQYPTAPATFNVDVKIIQTGISS